jgi:hypothetical protein
MKITLPYTSSWWKPLNWAKKNCPSYKNYLIEESESQKYIHYYFVDDKDATIFALRWT